jgi:long-chain acyl-CoA synthetase
MVIPYFHVYGLTVGLMMGTWMGALQILIPKYDADVVLDAIKELRPTFFPAVPTIYASLLKHPRLMESRPDLVQTYNSGSAPLPAAIREGFEEQTGATINEGYGLSEASPVTHSMPLLVGRRLGSVGVPLPDTLVKLVDLATGEREVAAGEAGELCVAGPQIMKGYWRQPEETARAIRLDAAGRRWLHTGDIARVDPDGFTHIVGRKKDVVIVDGFNVYPSEVENVLRMCPGVLEAAVVGVSDAYHGETVHAAVVVQEGSGASPERIRRYCGQHLAPYKVPATVTLRSALPRSPVGKVLYRVLRDDAREEGAGASVVR